MLRNKDYGVLLQENTENAAEYASEELRTLGYTIIDSGFTADQVSDISVAFDATWLQYTQKFSATFLQNLDEQNIMRAPLTLGNLIFLDLITNKKLTNVLKSSIIGKFILNQQNGVINPPDNEYSQSAWHRDLPYQHFIASNPIAISALYCVDDFTKKNGATHVLPASHKVIKFPSKKFLENHATQIEAKAGQYILLDSMIFHCGGFNQTKKPRRAVNHVFTIPHIRQQINLQELVKEINVDPDQKEILGIGIDSVSSIEQYLSLKARRV